MFGNVLGEEQKSKLQSWMQMCKTGNNRIRSGVTAGWIVADKTGGGFHYGITNDLGVIWPSNCAPIILAIYYYNNNKNAKRNELVLGQIAKLAIINLH